MIKVVIVDDEKMIRDGLVYTMPWKEMQIEVVGAASNGRAALDIIRSKKPNLVLTDVRMPEMDGIELLKVLKEEMPNVKVVILSGYDDFQYAKNALKYGAVDYLVKPVNADELIKLLEEFKNSLKVVLDSDLININLQNQIDTELELYVTALRTSHSGNVMATAEQLYNKIIQKQFSPDQYHKVSIVLENLIIIKLKKYNIDLAETIVKVLPDINQELYYITNKEELREWLYGFTNRLQTLLDDKNSDNNSVVIRKALQFIDEHYKEDISVQRVAQAVFLNQNYFSHIFKKIKKESFTDYLNKIRIEKAKELLTNNLYKVYEVSDMVGYSDYKYFSSIFKKLVGVTPTEYNKFTK